MQILIVVSLVNICCSALAPLCNSCADVANYLRSDFRFVLFAFLPLSPLPHFPLLAPLCAAVLIPDSTAVSLAPVCRVVVPLVLFIVVVVLVAAAGAVSVAVTRALAAVVW